MADPSELFGNALMMGVRQGREAEQAQFENALRTKQLSMAEQQQNALLPLQVQQAQMGIASDQARIQAIREQSRLQAQEYARSVSADQIARETAETRQALMEASGAYKAGDQNAWNATISKYGLDPAQFPMDNAPALFAVAEGSLEVWEGLTAPKQQGFRPATPDEAKRYGAAAGQIDESTGRFHPINPPSGMVVQTGPDGALTVAQGPGVTPGSLTNANTTDAQKAAFALESAVGALDKYGQAFKDGGGGAVVPGMKKDVLLTARRDLQLQIKELYNLGVLNGPDLTILDQMMVDPTSIANVAMDAVGIADLNKRMEANTAQVREQLIRMAAPKMKALGLDVPGVVGQAAPAGSAASSAGPYQEPATPDFSTMSDAELEAFIARGGQ